MGIFKEHDLFNISTLETTDDYFKLSTAECFQLPEVFFALKNLQSECSMLSKTEVKTKNPSSDQNSTNFDYTCDFNELGMHILFEESCDFSSFLVCV